MTGRSGIPPAGVADVEFVSTARFTLSVVHGREGRCIVQGVRVSGTGQDNESRAVNGTHRFAVDSYLGSGDPLKDGSHASTLTESGSRGCTQSWNGRRKPIDRSNLSSS